MQIVEGSQMTAEDIFFVYGGTLGGCIAVYLMVVLIINAVGGRSDG